jgi:anti-sigma-K factor RskA
MAELKDEHEELDLLPGYALGSLDPEESDRVRLHVARCRVCRQELASYQEVTGRLAQAVPEQDPPPWLESRIMEKVLSHRRRRSLPELLRMRQPMLAAVAAVLIIALGAGNIYLLTRPFQSPALAPGLMTVVLTGTGETREAYGTIMLDRDDNRGVLAVHGLAPLGESSAYQLWIIRQGERRSGGVFTVTPDGYGSLQITVPAEFTGFTGFGISIEPAGGSTSPTGARVMSGRI